MLHTHTDTHVLYICIHYIASERIIGWLDSPAFADVTQASHKSNGVYLVINPKRWVVYQKCHDVADCPDFRSHEFALPQAWADMKPG